MAGVVLLIAAAAMTPYLAGRWKLRRTLRAARDAGFPLDDAALARAISHDSRAVERLIALRPLLGEMNAFLSAFGASDAGEPVFKNSKNEWKITDPRGLPQMTAIRSYLERTGSTMSRIRELLDRDETDAGRGVASTEKESHTFREFSLWPLTRHGALTYLAAREDRDAESAVRAFSDLNDASRLVFLGGDWLSVIPAISADDVLITLIVDAAGRGLLQDESDRAATLEILEDMVARYDAKDFLMRGLYERWRQVEENANGPELHLFWTVASGINGIDQAKALEYLLRLFLTIRGDSCDELVSSIVDKEEPVPPTKSRSLYAMYTMTRMFPLSLSLRLPNKVATRAKAAVIGIQVLSFHEEHRRCPESILELSAFTGQTDVSFDGYSFCCDAPDEIVICKENRDADEDRASDSHCNSEEAVMSIRLAK